MDLEQIRQQILKSIHLDIKNLFIKDTNLVISWTQANGYFNDENVDYTIYDVGYLYSDLHISEVCEDDFIRLYNYYKINTTVDEELIHKIFDYLIPKLEETYILSRYSIYIICDKNDILMIDVEQ